MFERFRFRRSFARATTAVIATTVLLGGGVFFSPAAHAATQPIFFSLTGTAKTGSQTLTLPAGSGFSGMIDPSDGDISAGAFSFPQFHIAGPGGIDIVVDVTNTGEVTGFLDPDGTAEFDGPVQVQLTINAGPAPVPVCVLGPYTTNLSTENTNGAAFTGDPLTGTVADAGYTVPAVQTTGSCASAVASTINQMIGLPSTATSTVLTLTQTTTPPTTPPPTTTPPTTAAAAAAVATEPKFTG